VKIHGLDTNWRPLENRERVLRYSLQALKKPSFTQPYLEWGALLGSIYTSHTNNHLKEVSLDTQKAYIRLLVKYMLTWCCMHTNRNQTRS